MGQRMSDNAAMELMTGRGILAVIPIPPKARADVTPKEVRLLRCLAARHLRRAAYVMLMERDDPQAAEHVRAAMIMIEQAAEAEVWL